MHLTSYAHMHNLSNGLKAVMLCQSTASAIAGYGEPEEIAELTAFLVSPGARWMTGSTLRMDGGEVKSI